MYHVRITDPRTGRVYMHGEQYRTPGTTANVPMDWPTLALAQIVADDVTAAGKLAEVVEVPDALPEPKPESVPSPAKVEPGLFDNAA